MRTRSDGPAAEKAGKGRPKRRRSSASVEDTKITTTTEEQHDQMTSEAPLGSSQPSLEASQGRRKKRARKTSVESTSHSVKETTERVHHDHPDTVMSDEEHATDGDNETTHVSDRRSKRVRFSDPGPPIVEIVSSVNGAAISPTGLTSGLEDTALTPTDTPHPTKQRTTGRHSLPATLSSSPDGPVQQLQFSPLRAVLDERVRRRLRRSHLSEEVNEIEEHKREDARTRHELDKLRQEVNKRDERVKQLMLELELQRQLGIEVIGEKDEEDERVREMEEELARLRKEIAEAREAGGLHFGGDADGINHSDEEMDDADDNGLVLVDPADIDVPSDEWTRDTHRTVTRTLYSTASSGLSATLVSPTEAATQVSLPDPIEETERHEFEKAIATLTREASDARAALQIMLIELQSLGFAPADASAETVLSSIRSAFYQARTELEELLPGETPGNIENGALLNLLLQHVRGLLQNVHVQTETLESHEKMEHVLRKQLGGLLDKLADVDSRKHMLESQWRELDVEAERKEKDIVELNSQLDVLESESQEHTLTISQKNERIQELEADLATQATSIERLQSALQGYRDEVAGLEELIVKLDQQHRNSIAQLKKENADTVAALEDQIQVEKSYRETAEAEIDGKTTRITALELDLEATATSLDELRSQVERTQALAVAERDLRETAENSLADQAAIIESLETKVSAAEADLESLHVELESLRTLASSERHQRQSAEALLDEREAQLSELENKLHEAGITANLLREKLFEKQQVHEREVAELQSETLKRENQFQNDIAAEIERREEAERDEASTREALNELEEAARETEQTLREEVTVRDERIRVYEQELGQTQNALEEAKSQYVTLEEDHERALAQLQSDLEGRDYLIASREFEFEKLETTATQTGAELATARETISNLESVRASLERRIEAEAEELLAAEERHAALENQLRSEMADMTGLNTQLRSEMRQREHDLQLTVTEKNLEISALKSLVAARENKLAAVTDQALMLRAALRERVAKEKIEMGRVADEMRELANRVDVDTQDFMAEGVELLRSVDAEAEVDVEKMANGNGVGEISHEHKSLRSEIGIGPNGMTEEQSTEVAVAVASVEKRAIRKTSAKKRRGRRREFDSGIGVAAEEEVEEGQEMEEVGWV